MDNRRYYTSEGGQPRRRLYRSRYGAMIGGVCAGLADYLDVDPSIVRLVTVLLVCLMGMSIFVYIIVWIVVPLEPVSNGDGYRQPRDEYRQRRG